MNMTKEEFAAFRDEIETALAPLAAKYGCIVKAGNIKYDIINTTVSVAFKSQTEDKSADQLNFEMYCNRYGFDRTDYGFTFTHDGKTYKFISFRTTARKYPCICDCSDGKQYAYEAAAMLEIMRRERAKA